MLPSSSALPHPPSTGFLSYLLSSSSPSCPQEAGSEDHGKMRRAWTGSTSSSSSPFLDPVHLTGFDLALPPRTLALVLPLFRYGISVGSLDPPGPGHAFKLFHRLGTGSFLGPVNI